MKKMLYLVSLLVVGIWAGSLYAADVPASGHAADSASRTARPGKQIRQTGTKGYTLTYHLMDLSERGEMVKAMGHHSVIGMSRSADATNHLMVYIQRPDGKLMPADVAFLVAAPDGRDFRTMTMGMHGGYGVDVNLKLKGLYTIRTRIITEGDAAKLDDEFVFQVK